MGAVVNVVLDWLADPSETKASSSAMSGNGAGSGERRAIRAAATLITKR